MRPSKNKGEWGELHIFALVMSRGSIFSRRHQRNIQVVQTQRVGTNDRLHTYDVRDGMVCFDGKTISQTYLSKLVTALEKVLKRDSKKHKSSFTTSEGQQLMELLELPTPNAPSNSKADFRIKMEGEWGELEGVSCKSRFGRNATLLNASQLTNFIYEFQGEGVEALNGMDAALALNAVSDSKGVMNVCFSGMQSPIFRENLGTDKSHLLASMTLLHRMGHGNSFFDLCAMAAAHLKMDSTACKKMLGEIVRDVDIGMVPKTIYDGNAKAIGGLIYIDSYGIPVLEGYNNMPARQDYLYNASRIDQGCKSKTHSGVVYQQDGRVLIKLNLQIRLTKLRENENSRQVDLFSLL